MEDGCVGGAERKEREGDIMLLLLYDRTRG